MRHSSSTRWSESERVSTVNRVGVWKSSSGCRMNSTAAVGDLVGVWRSRSGCRMGSTTAVGDDVLSVSPNNAAEYDRGLGVPLRAAPLGGSQCEPVATRSYRTAEGENNLWGVGSKVLRADIACPGWSALFPGLFIVLASLRVLPKRRRRGIVGIWHRLVGRNCTVGGGRATNTTTT